MSVTSQVAEFVNPFPGLRAYEYSEYPLFFGREGQSLEILRRLGNRRFVSVIGISGSGKSSLIRAGLLPYLDNAYLRQAGSRWRKAIFRPGSTPIANLAAALTGILTDPEHPMPDGFLDSTLHSSGLGLIKAVQYAHLPPQDNVLIIVDQMEELFRFAKRAEDSRRFDQEDEASAFVKLLLEAVAQTEIPIYVVITMRSDFIGDCARFRDLPEAVNDGLYLIPRMIRDQRRQAIVGPIEAVGRQIAPRLVNRLLNDVGDSPDQLPLLQHALMRTYDRWVSDHAPNEPVDLRHYEAIGGLTEALSRHADEAYGELPDEAHREIARRMFQSLTEKSPDGREVRRPSPVSEIMARTAAPFPQVARTIDTFRRAGRSFLMPPPDVPLDANTIIDISHESLIGGWAQLRKWVDDEAQSAAVYRRLADTAALYDNNQAGLYRDPDLQIALTWCDREHPNEQWARRYHPGFASAMSFLDKSRESRDAGLREAETLRRRELDRSRRELTRSRAFAAVLAVVGFAAIALAILASHNAKNYERAAFEANRANQAAQAATRAADAATAAAVEEAKRENVANTQLNIALAEAKAATSQAEASRAEAFKKEKEANHARDDFRQIALQAKLSLVENMQRVNALTDDLIALQSPLEATYAHRRKEIALSQLGDHQRAVAELNKALDIQPDNLSALSSRGYENLLIGHFEDSIRDSKAYLQTDPRNGIVLLNLALAQGVLGQYDQAIKNVNLAIDGLDPSSYGMYESELAPDIVEATGRQILVADSAEYKLALKYELAALRAFKGDPEFSEALAAADREAATSHAHLDTALYSTLNWVWLHFRDRGKDYSALAVAGALWERIARLDSAFQGCPHNAYLRFQQLDLVLKDPRYRPIASWVAKQPAGQHSGASCGYPTTMDPSGPALSAEILDNRTSDYSALLNAARINWYLSQSIDQARRDSSNRDVLIQLLSRRARLRYLANDKAGSRADALEVVKLTDRVSTAFYYLALTDSDLEQKDLHFRQALDADPADSGPIVDYSSFLAPEGSSKPPSDENLKRALALSERYTRYWPQYASGYRRVAWLQHELGEDSAALRSINSAISIAPWNTAYYDFRAKVETSLHYDAAAVVRHRAAGYRRAGDFQRHSGDNGHALALYLGGLRLLVAALPSTDPDFQFEMELAIRNISEFLVTSYSPKYAEAFWRGASSDSSLKPVQERLTSEVARIVQGGSR